MRPLGAQTGKAPTLRKRLSRAVLSGGSIADPHSNRRRAGRGPREQTRQFATQSLGYRRGVAGGPEQNRSSLMEKVLSQVCYVKLVQEVLVKGAGPL